jgi:hypothetical protein
VVQSQQGQKVSKISSQPIAGCRGMCLLSQAVREAEMRKIGVPGRLCKKSLQDPISMEKKLGMVAHTCHSSYSRKHKIGG